MPDTTRTIMRPLEVQDLAFMSEFYQHPEHVRYLPQLQVPVRQLLENREKHWRDHGFGTYLVLVKDSGIPIGYCGVEYANGGAMVDIRFGITRERWGRGYATEVARRVLELSFTQFHLPIVYGAALPGNAASLKVLQAIGMSPTADFNVYGPNVASFYAREPML